MVGYCTDKRKELDSDAEESYQVTKESLSTTKKAHKYFPFHPTIEYFQQLLLVSVWYAYEQTTSTCSQLRGWHSNTTIENVFTLFQLGRKC